MRVLLKGVKKTNLPLLYLSSLLHDVGKNRRYLKKQPECTDDGKKYKGISMVEHHLTGTLLLHKKLPEFNGRKELLALVSHHHSAKNKLLRKVYAETGLDEDIIKRVGDELSYLRAADKLASSISRLSSINPDILQQHGIVENQLCSPLWVLRKEEFYPVPLEEHNYMDFPYLNALHEALSSPSYFDKVWADIRKKLYPWLAPPPEDKSKSRDTTVLTHSRLTAALAMTFAAGSIDTSFTNKDGPLTDEIGELSGIYTVCFIFHRAWEMYNLPSDGFLRQVRGRASLLSAATDAYAMSVLERAGLPPECQILRWDTGCVLILPESHLSLAREMGEKLKEDLSSFSSFAWFRITASPVNWKRLNKEELSSLLLGQAVENARNLAMHGKQQSQEAMLLIGDPPSHHGPFLVNASRCNVCGRPSKESICLGCMQIDELGRSLNNIKELGLGPAGDGIINFSHLGISVSQEGAMSFQPPISPGGIETEDTMMGFAIIKCGAWDVLLQRPATSVLPGRLIECFNKLNAFFDKIREYNVKCSRWSLSEMLVFGHAIEILQLCTDLEMIARKETGFGLNALGVMVNTGICRHHDPIRDIINLLQEKTSYVFALFGKAFEPATVLNILNVSDKGELRYALIRILQSINGSPDPLQLIFRLYYMLKRLEGGKAKAAKKVLENSGLLMNLSISSSEWKSNIDPAVFNLSVATMLTKEGIETGKVLSV